MVHSITFDGTSKRNLIVYDLPPVAAGPVASIEELLRQTTAFRGYYDVRLPPDPYYSEFLAGTWNETWPYPEINIIRGSPVKDIPHVETLPTNHGLVGTVLTAYNLHQNLQLRPDDVWITILAQLSLYVNGRAEELRSKIVKFDGRMQLIVRSQDYGANIQTADFGSIIMQFLDLMSVNVKQANLTDWFLPGFTTTTDTDKVSAAAMAMCSFQEYFAFRAEFTCGLPQITLLGSVEDWVELLDKVERLVEFDGQDKILSEQWIPRLRMIVSNFVLSAESGSSQNIDFWNQIVTHDTAFGCTGPEDMFTGWLSTFSIFDKDGNLIANLNHTWPVMGFSDIYHNVASCPMTIFDHGTTYNATLFVGQMAYDYAVDFNATQDHPQAVQGIPENQNVTIRILKPRNDWALAIEESHLVNQYSKLLDFSYPPDATILLPLQTNGSCPENAYNDTLGPAIFLNLPPPGENSNARNATTSPQKTFQDWNNSGDTISPPIIHHDVGVTGMSSQMLAGNNRNSAAKSAAWAVPVAFSGFLLLGLLVWLIEKKIKCRGDIGQSRPNSFRNKSHATETAALSDTEVDESTA